MWQMASVLLEIKPGFKSVMYGDNIFCYLKCYVPAVTFLSNEEVDNDLYSLHLHVKQHV